jgi:DNA polymerase-3 subunit delta
MTAIRPPGLEAFLRKPDPAIAAIMIYGDEAEAVRELAQRVVAKVAGSSDDPFSVTTIAEQDLASDPGRLADEVQSISMFGGARAIWVKGVGEAFLKAVAPVLEAERRGNLVVAEAAALSKSSELRKLFETSPHALVLPLYEAKDEEIAASVARILAQDNLQIGDEALARFIELAGFSRALVKREAEKLALYALGAGRVSLADVEAVCGNDTGATTDELADSVFGGDIADADRLFHDLLRSGRDPGQLLSAVQKHAFRLADFRLAVERGTPAEQAVKQARPPVFFNRQQAVQAQLRAWTLADLVKAGNTLSTQVLAARQNGDLAATIASRCVLSLARKGLSLRTPR